MESLSLRSRVLLAATLWTVGLLSAAVLGSTAILMAQPGYARLMHLAAESHAPLVTGLAALCMVLGLVQLRKGFAPFGLLRSRLSEVREGREKRMDGQFPAEIQPLVTELNGLLEDRERRVERALARAGDLAHGLKTPLAVLAQEADRAAAGDGQLPVIVRQQVARMQRQIDRHLAHARAAVAGATPGARCHVLDAAQGLERTLRRLHAARHVAIDLRVPPDHAVRGQREDLDEMIGNLLDNGCKWARSRVILASEAANGRIRLTVDDDGLGLDPAMWEAVLKRGVRADEAAPGSGFGLAIVRELAELYGGGLSLERSPIGGVRATLDLPAA